MTGRLAGKVALVTGAAQGQGREYAVRLAEEGADLIVIDRCEQDPIASYPMGTQEGLTQTAQLVREAGRRAIAQPVDVRDPAALGAAVDDAVGQLGRLDVVVANAGICTSQPWDAVTPEIWNTTLATNLTGAWYTCQAAAPHLIRAGGGSIILVSSAAGLRGVPFQIGRASCRERV